MSTSYPSSKQTLADETAITPVVYTKQNTLYDTVESLQDEVGYSGDLASDVGSIRSQLRNQQAIGTHSSDIVAAAASLTLPATRYVTVTGTTTVTSIVASGSDDKRQVVLDVQDALTITDGNNIDLGGSNYNGPGFLVLVCDGTDWHELGRLPGLTTGHAIVVGSGSGTTLPDQPNLHFSESFSGTNDIPNSETEIGLNFGTTAGTVAQGNDSRLSDSRIPTAHASSHITGGSDIISLFGINTRGLVPGPTNADGTKFLNNAGQWIPASSAGMPTIYGPDGIPLTQRTIIQAVGEMAEAEDASDDRTLLWFRSGKHSATALTAAATLAALPTDGNIITINGNTNISEIPAPTSGYEKRLVYLYFTGTPTVLDGVDNLQLDGDYEAISGGMLGLFHDTANWVEFTRSPGNAGGGGGVTDPTNSLTFNEGSAPSTPASGKVIVYAKSDGIMYQKDDAGTELPLAGGTSGGSFIPSVTLTPPAVGDFTWDNQGSATAVDEHDSIRFKGPASATNQWHVLFDSIGALPKTITVGIVPIRIQPIQFQQFGLCVRESVGDKLQGIGLWFESGTWQFRTINMTSSTSFSASANNQIAAMFGPVYFFQVEQNGSGNRIWRISPNGLQWADWVTTTFNDFTGTPDEAGFFVGSMSSSQPIDVAVVHWSVV